MTLWIGSHLRSSGAGSRAKRNHIDSSLLTGLNGGSYRDVESRTHLAGFYSCVSVVPGTRLDRNTAATGMRLRSVSRSGWSCSGWYDVGYEWTERTSTTRADLSTNTSAVRGPHCQVTGSPGTKEMPSRDFVVSPERINSGPFQTERGKRWGEVGGLIDPPLTGRRSRPARGRVLMAIPKSVVFRVDRFLARCGRLDVQVRIEYS